MDNKSELYMEEVKAETSQKHQESGDQLEKKEKSGKSTGKVLEEALKAMKGLQMQQEFLMKFQKRNYEWHRQHHDNLATIVRELNGIGTSMREKYGIDFNEIQISDKIGGKKRRYADFAGERPTEYEDDETEGDIETHMASMQSYPGDSILGLHEFILENKDNIYLEEVQRRLLSIEQPEFDTLQEESIEVVLPLIQTYLDQGEDQFQFQFALIFIAEVINSHHYILLRTKWKNIANKSREELGKYDVSKIGMSEEEKEGLTSFLEMIRRNE